jgi:hypothetical protein
MLRLVTNVRHSKLPGTNNFFKVTIFDAVIKLSEFLALVARI